MKSPVHFVLALCIGAVVSVIQTARAAEAAAEAAVVSPLKNPELHLAAGGKSVTGWRMLPADLPLAEETEAEALPEGVASALKITVVGVRSAEGQLIQSFSVGEGDPQRYELSGWMRSEVGRVGYVQVKLYKGKKELSRESVAYSGTRWAPFKSQIDATGATKVEILCRWRHYDKYEGKGLWFAGLTLRPVERVAAMVGDSTMQNYPAESARRGWGQLLSEELAPGVGVQNFAKGGASSRTFRAEGIWQRVLDGKPDAVLIQFGHNDSHEPGRPEATEAGGEFSENLRAYVREARAAGISPVLVTPPQRRVWANGAPSKVLAPYAEATRAVAAELKVPCIDLFAASDALLRERGEDGSQVLYCSIKDRSHFSEAGARFLAGVAAEGLRGQGPGLASLVMTAEAKAAAAAEAAAAAGDDADGPTTTATAATATTTTTTTTTAK